MLFLAILCIVFNAWISFNAFGYFLKSLKNKNVIQEENNNA